mgnify:CR=1 FL=1
MDVFQQKTKILQYETVQEFLRDFTFQKKDYILASRSIYEAFFRDSTGRLLSPFTVIMVRENPMIACWMRC